MRCSVRGLAFSEREYRLLAVILDMDNGDDLTQSAFVFWMPGSRLRAGGVTRFDSLEDAVNSVMQHAFARTASVAWIKTMNRDLDMDQIRGIARHSGTNAPVKLEASQRPATKLCGSNSETHLMQGVRRQSGQN
jgi:hypothetical protein